MNKMFVLCGYLAGVLGMSSSFADPDRTELVVWANEAIAATYTYTYKNFVAQQKGIARYFSAEGWMNYSKALTASQLPLAVQKNSYEVNAVATQPPILTTLDSSHWVVTMPILVVYKNPEYQQQQNLKAVLNFSPAPSGQGVRGYSITSLQATPIQPPCNCTTPTSTARAL